MPFDPYLTWLGISSDRRPPTYYDLLGIDPSEADSKTIGDEALRRIARVRQQQLGPNSDKAQEILSELSRARLILTDPDRRAAYDAKIGIKTAASTQSPVESAPLIAVAKSMPENLGPLDLDVRVDEDLHDLRPSKIRTRSGSKLKRQLFRAVFWASPTAIVIASIVYAMRSDLVGGPGDQKPADAASKKQLAGKVVPKPGDGESQKRPDEGLSRSSKRPGPKPLELGRADPAPVDPSKRRAVPRSPAIPSPNLNPMEIEEDGSIEKIPEQGKAGFETHVAGERKSRIDAGFGPAAKPEVPKVDPHNPLNDKGLAAGFGDTKLWTGKEFVNNTWVIVGNPQLTLLWDTDADLDLHVLTPNKQDIYWELPNYLNPLTEERAGGLDVDNKVGFGPENVYFLTRVSKKGRVGGPSGNYQWYVRYFNSKKK